MEGQLFPHTFQDSILKRHSYILTGHLSRLGNHAIKQFPTTLNVIDQTHNHFRHPQKCIRALFVIVDSLLFWQLGNAKSIVAWKAKLTDSTIIYDLCF
jgi:hypothetical protein